MNQPESSIFDLSPAEKLQLVVDLWDDLASTPGAVPVHEWQKQELARRKVNLQNNPASTLSWEDVKQKCAPAMGANLVVAPEAELDLTEAYIWYEARRVGLGEEFLGSVDARLERIRREPGSFPIVHESYRRALIRRFPYAVFFEYAETT